ncbi:putative leader peptide [Streptacidiphilus jiangxiensis]
MQRSPRLVSRGHIDLMRVASAACRACRPSR